MNVLRPCDIESLEHLNTLLFEYIRNHNTTIHSSTGEMPTKRFYDDLHHIKKPKDIDWLDACFMNRIQRRVRKDSTVSIDKILYDVPLQFIGAKVEIRFLPNKLEDNNCLENAYIQDNDLKYPIRKTNKVENSKTKRNNVYPIEYGGESHVD